MGLAAWARIFRARVVCLAIYGNNLRYTFVDELMLGWSSKVLSAGAVLLRWMDLLRPIMALGSCYATNDWSSCAIVNTRERTKAQEKTYCGAVFVIYLSNVSYDKVHKTSEKVLD